MKIKLFSLLCLMPLFLQAQVQKTVRFDFSNPSTLTPAVYPDNESASLVDVSDYVFTQGEISISFRQGAQYNGAYIYTSVYDPSKGETPEYTLGINRSTSILFNCPDGYSIERVEFVNPNPMGGLAPEDTKFGHWDYFHTWTKGDIQSAITCVPFNVSQNRSEQRLIDVTYIMSDIHTPKYSMADGSVIESFSSLQLTLPSKVIESHPEGIYLSDSKGQKLKQTFSAQMDKDKDSVVTISLETPFTQLGDYLLTVPARTFKTADNLYNKESVFHFTIYRYFHYAEVKPAPGVVDSLATGIILSYPEEISDFDKVVNLILYKDSVAHRLLELNKVDARTLRLDFKNVTDVIRDTAVYTITIPENTIFNAFKGTELELHNPAFELKYYIGFDPEEPGTDPDEPGTDPEEPGTDPEEPGTDPEEPIQPIDSDTMLLAKRLVSLTGVGYPDTLSASYLALKALVQAEEVPSDSLLAEAVKDYYAETQVAMPDSAKWYMMASVNAKGEKLYLSYTEDQAVTLSADSAQAARFKVNAIEGNVASFRTIHDKYLHVLAKDDEGLTTPSNVKDEFNPEVCNLTLTKLAAESVDLKEQLGLVTLTGLLKKTTSGKEVRAMALVNHKDTTVVTDSNEEEALFSDTLTHAFLITEVETPVLPITLKAQLDEYYITDEHQSLVITFEGDTVPVLSNAALPYFLLGKSEIPAHILPGDTTICFSVPVAALAEGSYTLVIPEGTFTCSVKDELRKVTRMTFNFTVKWPDFKENTIWSFNAYSDKYSVPHGVELYVTDTFFNDYIIESDEAMYYNPFFKVTLKNYLHNTTVRDNGIMQEVNLGNGNHAFKVVFTPAIAPGELTQGIKYTISFPQGVVGIGDYQYYIQGNPRPDGSRVNKSDCTVNKSLDFTYRISNEIASDIAEVDSDNSSTAIYTLQGTRVSHMKTPGIYIVNGRKVVVR